MPSVFSVFFVIYIYIYTLIRMHSTSIYYSLSCPTVRFKSCCSITFDPLAISLKWLRVLICEQDVQIKSTAGSPTATVCCAGLSERRMCKVPSQVQSDLHADWCFVRTGLENTGGSVNKLWWAFLPPDNSDFVYLRFCLLHFSPRCYEHDRNKGCFCYS